MAHKYKLVYFNGRARAESTRLLLAAAGIEYEDYRIEFADWPEEQKKAPKGSLPYLVIDGNVKVAETMAINRYFARISSTPLYGSDSLEALFIDEIADTASALVDEALKKFSAEDEAKMKEAMTKFNDETAPKLLGYLENSIVARAQDQKIGFAVGSRLSLADIMIYNAIENGNLEKKLSEYPNVKASREKVLENKGIADWLKTRPCTDM